MVVALPQSGKTGTMVATINAILWAGHVPVIVDTDHSFVDSWYTSSIRAIFAHSVATIDKNIRCLCTLLPVAAFWQEDEVWYEAKDDRSQKTSVSLH